MPDYRVGIGYDLHRLGDNRKLIIGGVNIPFGRGLLGHSDADVLLHAVIDALLGACGLPDIGEMFPDTDVRFKDADSRQLLAEVQQRVAAEGYLANNVDCVVHADKPKLSAYKRDMAQVIADTLRIDVRRVSVKAKTNEGVGVIGREEAIAATATVTVIERE